MYDAIAGNYGRALFEVGRDENKLKEIKNEVNNLIITFNENPELLKLLCHPQMLKAKKRELVAQVFEGNLCTEMVNFLYVLIDRKRIFRIFDILLEYEKFYNEYYKIKKAVIITARPLSQEKLLKTKETLEGQSDSIVEIQNIVEESIMGGAILEIDGKRVDGSIKSDLNNIRLALG